ncbi:NUDIX hydrolase [Roseovarius sp. ZX-A-9]|uniref:NUDIX hydrolase n=1 Tax=Roseovarius sp. ZX-A-9 TaxID=3014783 RepID=UPI00232BEE4B|nr:NUDIX hydrolase [Roseovarius sp. ZX-A-9]
MIRFLSAAWGDYVRPMFQRPKRLQVAALCHRGAGKETEVLLVTSRGTGRWIIPKGWPIRGLDSPQAALREAWEEAGVSGTAANRNPIGSYSYDKIMPAGLAVPVETLVYSVEVEKTATRFPEAHQRRRKWMSPSAAAELVNEVELKAILHNLARAC